MPGLEFYAMVIGPAIFMLFATYVFNRVGWNKINEHASHQPEICEYCLEKETTGKGPNGDPMCADCMKTHLPQSYFTGKGFLAR